MGIMRYNATRQLARLRSPVIVPAFRQLQRRPYATIMTKYPEFQDVMGCQAALFEWADSYDAKDWDRLRKCVAPSLMVDYRAFLNKKWDDMPADEFVQMASDSHFLGNKMIKTQHFHGGSRYEQESENKIIGYHQMRVAHQKYSDESLEKVIAKGHGHGTATIWYKKVDGVWKFAGLIPNTRWTEYDFHKIFHHDDAESEGESS